jgi:hypothetical protein
LVFIDDHPPVHYRELCPKDFYLAQILRGKDESILPLMSRLTLEDSSLDNFSVPQARKLLDWIVNELLVEKIMTVENWMEASYHLCKQRWDSSIDWLEVQPISKILTMIDIVNKHAEKQEAQMKKGSKR